MSLKWLWDVLHRYSSPLFLPTEFSVDAKSFCIKKFITGRRTDVSVQGKGQPSPDVMVFTEDPQIPGRRRGLSEVGLKDILEEYLTPTPESLGNNNNKLANLLRCNNVWKVYLHSGY